MQIKDILGYLLGTGNRLVKRKMDYRIEQYGITTSQWALIKLVDEKGALSQKQIADELLGDKATTGEVIKKLEAKGYIQRRASGTDKRAYIVEITDQAAAVIQSIEKAAADVTEEALRGLQKNEIDNLYKALNIIIKNMEE